MPINKKYRCTFSSLIIGEVVNYRIFDLFTHFDLLAPQIYPYFGNVHPLQSLSLPTVLVDGFEAGRQAGFNGYFIPKRQSMPFWFVLTLCKLAKHSNLPLTYE